ncbi:major facilitator superfamily domain-containing protein [Rhypophila decipiens]|uniref:Major facilitator superfamily domain-containing protein n=1 Tax=Rhypophila decipiens TaxID=261697 RepID=A0AAN6Y2F4_9PEZI|nr:major facilitator superfamily domain-containing protein [Rhypophila decipiens]
MADVAESGIDIKTEKKVDTVHGDEAAVVLANYDGDQEWTPAEEKKLCRKIDWKLMPVMCITYGLQYYDKAMLSQAATFGLREELGLLVGQRYSWSASIFYLGYIIGAYPAMVLAQRYPVERVAMGLVSLWGLCLILTVVCRTYQELYAQRFFLGLLEAGVSPMFMLIVGSWYEKKEQAVRMGIWYCCTGYVSVVSPLINYGFGSMSGESTWKYMYYFGGAITIVWGIALLWILPGDPISAKGFDERERYILVARLRSNNSGVRNTHFKVEQVVELLLDVKFWLLFSIAFLSMIANGPISTFIPIIIGGFGYSKLNSLLLMMPCGVWSGTTTLLASWLAFKLNNARNWLIIASLVGTTLAACLLWLLPLSNTAGLLYAMFTLPSLGASYGVLMGLQMANTAGYTKRSIASSGLYIGYCLGNFVGPLVFKQKDAPRYGPGFIIVVITCGISIILTIIHRSYCIWDNKRRDAAGIPEGFDHAFEDDSTDLKNPQFRYVFKEIVVDWLHYDTRLPKRKRAELVCSSCHSKKVKCDLQTQTQAREEQGHSGHGICSNCFSAGRDCVVYISKRKRHHSTNDVTSSHGGNSAPSASVIAGANGKAGAENPHVQGPRSPSESGDAIQVNTGATAIPPPSALPAPGRASHTTTPQSHLSDSHIPGGASTSRSNPIDVDTGFLHVYQVENQMDAERQELEEHHQSAVSILNQSSILLPSDAQQAELTQIFAETYMEYCYPWCPVLDIPSIPSDTLRSPLLANALALASSHIRPPLIRHDGPKTYYRRATSIFYNDEEPDGLTTLQAISLFYWWAPRSPALARRHSSWWWTSVLIRHAQQMNFHREPGPNHPLRDGLQLGLRRRIWWTAFARERLTALCQSKPCIIDPEDCNIQELTLDDFPADPRLQRKGEIFIYWVRLCAIIGRVAKTLSRTGASSSEPNASAPTENITASLRNDLIEWITSLPAHLQLPIESARTETFDKDVHQLHLPYLTTIIILHLRRSTTSSDLPHALPPAILAASCIVRIMRDILSRGDTRFLMPITCWYSGTAFIALLQAVRIREIAADANEGLDVLTGMINQLRGMWGSANVVGEGFERLRRAHSGGSQTQSQGGQGLSQLVGERFTQRTETGSVHGNGFVSVNGTVSRPQSGAGTAPQNEGDESRDDDAECSAQWPALFPFVTRQTSRIAKVLLPGSEPGIPPTRFPSPDNLLFHETFIQDYQGFFDPFDPYLGFGDVVNGIL